MKIAAFDTETTGLHTTCMPWQFACKIIDFENENIDYNIYFEPPASDMKELSQWVKDNTDLVKLVESGTLKTSEVAFNEIIDFLEEQTNGGQDKLIPMGQNIQFDLDVLARLFHQFKHTNHKYQKIAVKKYFDYHQIELGTISNLAYISGAIDFGKNQKLGTVAECLGVEVDEDSLHDARYDVEMAYEVFLAYNRILTFDMSKL